MKLPILNKIRLEDYPEAPTWFSGVAYVLNKFMDGMWNLLNSNLSFQDNFNCQIYEYTSDGSVSPFLFRKTLKTKVKGVIILELYPLDGSLLTEGVFPQWTDTSDGAIKMNIIGLPAKKCFMRLLVV